MIRQFLTGATPRAKLRRLALAVLLAFCVISAGLHFTVGSLIAALLPERQIQADVPEHITILTFERRRDFPRHIPTAQERKVAVRDTRHQYVKPIRIVQQSHLFIVGTNLPKLKESRPFRSLAKERRAGRTTVANMAPLKTGSGSPLTVLTTAQGANGDSSGDDVNYAGHPIPTGAVWSDQGPPGQSGSGGGGGVVLGGTGSRPVITIHDSCSPSRGNFIGSF